MPTNRLYYFDSTKLDHTATVTAIHDSSVELDETIFHPQGGGQPSDIGTINGIPVINITDNGEQRGIQHELATTPNFKVGETVVLQVEKTPRVLFSRLHTAGHLIAHVTERLYPGLTNPNGHHFPGEARVVFKMAEGSVLPPKDEIEKTLLSALVGAITKNSSVVSDWKPDGGRTITIDGFPTTPCGGTHVNSLAEIGAVTFRKIEAKRGTLKLSYNVG